MSSPADYMTPYMRRYRAQHRPWRSKIKTHQPEREQRQGHCVFCGLRSIGVACLFCQAEIEGRPVPRA